MPGLLLKCIGMDFISMDPGEVDLGWFGKLLLGRLAPRHNPRP